MRLQSQGLFPPRICFLTSPQRSLCQKKKCIYVYQSQNNNIWEMEDLWKLKDVLKVMGLVLTELGLTPSWLLIYSVNIYNVCAGCQPAYLDQDSWIPIHPGQGWLPCEAWVSSHITTVREKTARTNVFWKLTAAKSCLLCIPEILSTYLRLGALKFYSSMFYHSLCFLSSYSTYQWSFQTSKALQLHPLTIPPNSRP